MDILKQIILIKLTIQRKECKVCQHMILTLNKWNPLQLCGTISSPPPPKKNIYLSPYKKPALGKYQPEWRFVVSKMTYVSWGEYVCSTDQGLETQANLMYKFPVDENKSNFLLKSSKEKYVAIYAFKC